MPKIVIIGGVAGGMSAAARLRRISEDSEIIVLEKGEYVSYANCGLPYYIGGAIQDESALTLQTPESFKKRFNVDVRVNSEAVAIDRKTKKVKVKNTAGNKEYEESYDKLILSPGAEPIKPPIPGIDNPKIFTLRTIPDTMKVKEYINKHKPSSAAVIGGGYIGIEMAENLKDLGLDVTVIEVLPQVLNVFDPEMASIAASHMKQNGVKLMLGQGAKEIKDEKDGIKIILSGGSEVKANLAILAIGVKPDVKLAKESSLAVDRGISVNEYLQTSDPDIYAVGDAIEVLNPVLNKKMPIPLAGPANKQGRIAADNIIEGNKKKYRGTLGTAVLKVFGLTAATTGSPEKSLKAAAIPCESIIIHPASHAGYYPGATGMSLKLIFSPGDGKILGAQAIGADMAEKKIDVISALIRMKGTVNDLTEFEQAYAPPYNSAKDAVNMAGFVAENVLSGKIRTISWQELLASAGDFTIIDARSAGEFRAGSAPGAVNFPVDNIRNMLDKVPKGKKIAVYCGVGIRSYITVRILMQKGFKDVYNISGGFLSYMQIRG